MKTLRVPKQSSLLPKTWKDRGVTVPFTSPELALTRMRRHEELRREFILPNPSGGSGFYVIPWNSLRTMVPVTVHDRLLFDLIEKHEADDPLRMHRIKLQAAATGLAGPDAAKLAQHVLTREQSTLVLTTFSLVSELLKSTSIAMPASPSDDSRPEAVQDRIRAAVHHIAALWEMPASVLYGRIETLAELALPLGLRQAVEPGRLRQLAGELHVFAKAIGGWVEMVLSETTALAEFEASTAEAACKLVSARIDGIDRRLASLPAILTSWDNQAEQLSNHIRELAWLLDGWDQTLGAWRQLPAKTPHDQTAAVIELYPLTPIAPTSVIASISEQQLEVLSSIQRRRVPPYTDWRTGMVDFDQVRRIETLKAATLIRAPGGT